MFLSSGRMINFASPVEDLVPATSSGRPCVMTEELFMGELCGKQPGDPCPW